MKSKRTESAGGELPSAEYLRVGALPGRELEAILLRGETPDPERLAGWEFRGMNTFDFAKVLGIKKFVKGFYRSAAGQLFGYNMPIRQNPIDQAWEYKNPSDPKRFGFFRVDPVDAALKDNAYLHALLLDYGRGGNSDIDPMNGLRDYLVRVERGSDDLLLGKAYYAVGPLRVPTGFFLLERMRPSDFRR